MNIRDEAWREVERVRGGGGSRAKLRQYVTRYCSALLFTAYLHAHARSDFTRCCFSDWAVANDGLWEPLRTIDVDREIEE